MKFTLLRGACITTICLTTQSLQPTDKEITTKKEALALTESKQSRSLCWWLWQVHSLAEEWGKIKTLWAVAKVVAEVIFSIHSLLDLLRDVSKLTLLFPKQKSTSRPDNGCGLTQPGYHAHSLQAKTEQKPLMMIRATTTKHLIGQDKKTFKMYIMMHQIWAMHTSNLFLQNKWLIDPLADLGCLMLQEDAVNSLNFFLTTYLLR